MESLTLQPIARVDGTINLPGSKSVSNRALLLAALARGTTVLTNLLDSDDVRHMLNAWAAPAAPGAAPAHWRRLRR